MTLREIFEAVLVEINKVQAPSLLLEDFNYFANKAQVQFVNKCYNLFETTQQKNDDLRALKNTVIFNYIDGTLTEQTEYPSTLHNHTYIAVLPNDYFHLLNCIVEYNGSDSKCSNGRTLAVGASRITSDQYPSALRNYYLQPSWKRPYYFINKVNKGKAPEDSTKNTAYINRIEIRLGNSPQIPERVYIDYLQIPEKLELTEDQLNDIDDTSQILQFPEYVCQEIVNEIVKLVLENISDPRLQTNPAINQSIGG